MEEIGKILLGALVGFIAAIVTENIKKRNASKAIAMMLLRELEFHKQRLSMAIQYDAIDIAEYELTFPSPIWDAKGADFVTGVSVKKAAALLNWYASLIVLGYRIGKQPAEDGQTQLIGPDRNHMLSALKSAYETARQISEENKNSEIAESTLPLFTEIKE